MKPERESREAMFRSEIRAGHVPEKARKPKKRTRAAQARSADVEAMRAAHGEAYVHATPLQRFGAGLRAAIAARNAA